MHRRVLAFALVALPVSGLLQPAQADHSSWSAAAAFTVGDARFSLGYFRPSYHGPFYRPQYFYRVRQPLAYRGYRCTSACFVRDDYYYHSPACPVVHRHFQRHDYRPAFWGPPGWGGDSHGYGHHGRGHGRGHDDCGHYRHW